MVRNFRKYLTKIGGSAYIKREEKIIRNKLHDKRINVRDITLVSARQYSLCLDAGEDNERPKLTAEATGIPLLRRHLLELPALENYDILRYHVHETLPDIVAQTQRILTKFVEDAIYAEMRKDLTEWLPTTRNSLEDVASLLIRESVTKPWDLDKTETAILKRLESYVSTFVHPTPYYATFLKIIKENGIPVNGKAKGRNMNEEILGKMEEDFKRWSIQLEERVANIATGLDTPIQVVLRQLKSHLEKVENQPDLKCSATEALGTKERRTGMAKEKLTADLETRLYATYVHYTTETHIQCPIALAMAPVYHSVLDVKGGPGAYHRHREHLLNRLCKPEWPFKNFPQTLATNIANTQKESWMQCCRGYITEVMAQLEGFRQIADDLLDSGGYVKADQRELRDKLQTLLPAFQESVVQVQKACPPLETSVETNPAKRKRHDDE